MKRLRPFGFPIALAFFLGAIGVHSVAGTDEREGAAKPPKVDHSSPQALAGSLGKAARQKDWDSVFACATKRAQLSFLGGFFLTEPGKSAETALQGILKKHGIDPRKPPKPGTDPIPALKTKAAIFGDLAAWSEKIIPRKPGDGPNTMAELLAKATFKNFRIDGNKATAEVVVAGKSGRLPRFEFRRIDRKWYVHCDFAADANANVTRIVISGFEQALKLYARGHSGTLLKSPKASQSALLALTKPEKVAGGKTLGPYLEVRVLKDVWGNRYYYQYPHPMFPKGDRPGIWSAGPDGKSGTKDDIANWTTKRPAER